MLTYFLNLIYLTHLLKKNKKKKNLFVNFTNFRNTFRDSGLFDFLLLYFFDLIVRNITIYSNNFSSEFSIVEKSSWRLNIFLVNIFRKLYFLEINQLNQIFYQNIFFFIFLNIFFLLIIFFI
jgi:hypothetical protein